MSVLNYFLCLLKCILVAFLAFALMIPAGVVADEWLDEPEEIQRNTREKTIYFPQFQPVQSVSNEAYMVNQIMGKLALSDECLRVISGERGYLLIWPGWYTFDIVSRDIVISNLRTGAVVAQLRIGDTVRMSGGELQDRPYGLKYVIPDQCKGPYWAVGDIQSARMDPQPKKTYIPPFQEVQKPQPPPKRYNYVERESPLRPILKPIKPVKYQKRYSPPLPEIKKPVVKEQPDKSEQPKPINVENDPELEKSMVR